MFLFEWNSEQIVHMNIYLKNHFKTLILSTQPGEGGIQKINSRQILDNI